MKFIGLFLLLTGLASLVLGFTGANLVVLNWLSQWGETASWGIRIGIAVLGGILYFVYRNDD